MRLLLVEDDPAIAAAVGRGLVASGFVTDVAASGPAGLELAVTGSYDAVLLDLGLPGLSGYEVCRRLRQSGSRVPLVVLTARDGEAEEAEALDLGADDFITKPFSLVVLRARLRAVVRRGQLDPSVPLVLGDLVLDPGTHRCHRAGVEVHLTPRELDLLAFLLRHPGQVLSRGQLADHVWDGELDVDSRVVEVYIGYLRRKLDAPFGTDSLQTVRGAGYRLVAAWSGSR